jgi:hypothetical protein
MSFKSILVWVVPTIAISLFFIYLGLFGITVKPALMEKSYALSQLKK